ncbi:MAG: hypothetical protein AB3N64_14845 [Puniceicoccaceae bacterium]
MSEADSSHSLVLTGNLWSLGGYPGPVNEWTEEDKIRFFAGEGFDAVTMGGRPGLGKWLKEEFDLRLCGFFQADTLQDIESAYLGEVEAGAETINSFLGTPAATLDEAVRLFAEVDRLERLHGVPIHVETHRATMLEVPEFALQLYQASHANTGLWPRLCHDDSHISVVKHFSLSQLTEFLELHRNPGLLKRSQQMHLRPFNGHHAQVPVLDPAGGETREFLEWMVYARSVVRAWQEAHEGAADLWIVPELGPVSDGYALSTGPDMLSELKHCVARIRELFRR